MEGDTYHMSISKLITRILGSVLALICLICLLTGIVGIKDFLDTRDYWEKIREDALEQFQLLEDGILQLKAGEGAYIDGVSTYEKGMETYKNGQASVASGYGQVAAGQAAYDEGAKKLAEGQAAYDAGAAKLEQSKNDVAAAEAELEAAKKALEDNRQAYEEGKELIDRIGPIYDAIRPDLERMDALKAEYDRAVADGDLIEARILEDKVSEQQLSLNLKLGQYSVNDIRRMIDEGRAKIAEYEAAEARVAEGEKKLAEAKQQIADGQAQLDASGKELEQGRQDLANGKKDLDEGRARLSGGQAALAEGEKKLEEGALQLAVYENGQLRLKDGLDLTIAQPTYFDSRRNPLITSIADRLGRGFTYYKLDKDGLPLVLNGNDAIDLDKALQVVYAGRDFVEDCTKVVRGELVSRGIGIAGAVLTAIIGLIAAVFGLCAAPLGSAITATIGHFQALILTALGFLLLGGLEFPMSRIAGSRTPGLGLTVIILLGVVLLFHAINNYVLTYFVNKEKKAAAAAAPAAPAAEAPAAE